MKGTASSEASPLACARSQSHASGVLTPVFRTELLAAPLGRSAHQARPASPPTPLFCKISPHAQSGGIAAPVDQVPYYQPDHDAVQLHVTGVSSLPHKTGEKAPSRRRDSLVNEHRPPPARRVVARQTENGPARGRCVAERPLALLATYSTASSRTPSGKPSRAAEDLQAGPLLRFMPPGCVLGLWPLARGGRTCGRGGTRPSEV